MKTLFLRLFILCIFFCGEKSYAQNCFEKIRRNDLYSGSNDIINGRKWIYQKKYLGSPLLMEEYWPKADISYNGSIYTGIVLNYDVVKNEIILFHNDMGKDRYIVLNADKLSGFCYTDTIRNRKHSYKYTELPGIKGKALYENASVGKTSFFIKPVKTIEAASAVGQGTYIDSYECYIDTGTGYISVNSRKQLLKLLSGHSSELNRFIRKNNLKINNRQPENIIAVLKYYEGLK